MSEIAQTRVTFPAGADLSTKQWLFGKVDSSGRIVPTTVLGENAIGVIADNPAAAGRECAVVTAGVVDVMAGGSITAGNYVVAGANGRAFAADTNATSLMGVAREDGSNGAIISVLLQPIGRVTP